MRTCLVCDGSLFGTLPVLRSLKRHRLRVLLVSGHDEVSDAGSSRYCDDAHVITHTSTDDIVSVLQGLVSREQVDVILPLTDRFVELLSENRDRLLPTVALAIPPVAAVDLVCDKLKTLRALEDAVPNLRVPRTWHVASPDEVSRLTIDTWPVVIKPRKASGALGIRWVGEPSQLPDAYRAVHRLFPLPIIQEFIPYLPGHKYQCLYLFDREHNLRSWYAHKVTHEMSTIRQAQRDSPVQGGNALAWLSHDDRELLELGKQAFETLGWEGFGFLELVRDQRDGMLKILEINPRLSGTIALALEQGVDFAYDACCVANGLETPERLSFETGVGGKHLLRGLGHALRTQRLEGLSLLLNPRYKNSSQALVDPLPYLHRAKQWLLG